jgi:hypothetical protein
MAIINFLREKVNMYMAEHDKAGAAEHRRELKEWGRSKP